MLSTSERPDTALPVHRDAALELRSLITGRYETKTEIVTIGNQIFSLLAVRDTNILLDAIDPAQFAEDERLPYWADLWPSSIELARVCLFSLPLSGVRVLELGCGLGLSGIAAARAGARVTLTDYEEDALLFAQWNAMANLDSDVCGSRVTYRHLDWRTPDSSEQYDVVIGSDIVYERRNTESLLRLLSELLSPDGYVVCTDPGRETGREFAAEASRYGFAVKTTEATVQWRDRQQRIVRCFLRRGRVYHD